MSLVGSCLFGASVMHLQLKHLNSLCVLLTFNHFLCCRHLAVLQLPGNMQVQPSFAGRRELLKQQPELP